MRAMWALRLRVLTAAIGPIDDLNHQNFSCQDESMMRIIVFCRTKIPTIHF
jgi:hypothetical protein